MNQKITITAYHGTTIENATNIIKSNMYNQSDNMDDWLGRGVYFYDTLDNAILYNIRKYINDNKEYPNYEKIKQSRCILVNKIECNQDEMMDFNNFTNLQKILGLWKMLYDRVKDDEIFKKLKVQDGYIINWLYDNTSYFDGCKIFKNTFKLDLRFRRKISKMFNKKTRIGYNINQVFICVVDKSCIRSVELYQECYEEEYNIIGDVINNILMEGDNDEI